MDKRQHLFSCLKSTRLYTATFLLAIAAALLISCGGTGTPPESTDVPAYDIQLITDNELSFFFTLPEKPSAYVTKAYQQISNTVASLTGKTLLSSPDDKAGIELLLGQGEDAETQKAISQVGYYQYVVTFVDEKLVVSAFDETVLENATDAFCKMLVENYNDGNLALSSDLFISGTIMSKRLIANIPYFDDGNFGSQSDLDDNYYMILVSDATREEFEAYTHKLEGQGYNLYTSNDMGGNLFYTFTRNKIMLHAYHVPYSNEVRIVIAEDVNLPALTPDPFEKKLQSSMVQLNVTQMGYIFQLEDGSFIIIDGGDNKKVDSDNIYKCLKDMAPDPQNIVITAWIFTHGHVDHTGAFMSFAPLYSGDSTITIENILYNFCLTPEQTTDFAVEGSWAKIKELKYKHYPDATVYKPITGERYLFANAEVEILYCMSDFVPELVRGDANIQTVVFTVTIAGQKVFIMGDTTTVNCNEMSARYGDYIKSDFVQMAHHGIAWDATNARNATIEIYSLIKPTYALWPKTNVNGAWDYVRKYEVNKYLFGIVKEMFISGSGNKVFLMPYNS